MRSDSRKPRLRIQSRRGMLNQFRHGFLAGGVPEYAEAFSEALYDLMAKHWPEGT